MERPNTGDQRLNDAIKSLQYAIDMSQWLTCTQKTCCLSKLYGIVDVIENPQDIHHV